MTRPWKLEAPARATTPGESPDRQLRWNSRGVLLGLVVLLPLIGILIYVGPAWPVACYRLVSDGGITLLWAVAAGGIGVTLLRATGFWKPTIPRSLRCVTAIAAGLGVLSLAILGMGLAGMLNAFLSWILLTIGVALAIIHLWSVQRGRSPQALRSWLREAAGWDWLWLIATPFLALTLTAAMTPPGILWTPEEPHGYDVVEYHLQVPREWYEAGKIIPLHHNVFSYVPFNVEMHYLLAMHLRGGPWAGMYLAQFMHLAFMMLAIAAVYGLARWITTPLWATLAALTMLTVPWITQLAPIAYDEGGFLLFAALAIGWAMRAAFDADYRLRRFALAGVMAGFAAGSKLTALPEVLVAVPLVAAGGMIAQYLTRSKIVDVQTTSSAQSGTSSSIGSASRNIPSSSPGAVGSADPASIAHGFLGIIVFCAIGAASFSPWLARNAVWTHNPVFPELMPLLGHGDFDSAQVQRWDDSLKPPVEQRSARARAVRFGNEILADWQFGYVLLPLGLLACAMSWRNPMAWFLLGLLIFLTAFWLMFTHLQGRFFILAVPIAALLIAQASALRRTNETTDVDAGDAKLSDSTLAMHRKVAGPAGPWFSAKKTRAGRPCHEQAAVQTGQSNAVNVSESVPPRELYFPLAPLTLSAVIVLVSSVGWFRMNTRLCHWLYGSASANLPGLIQPSGSPQPLGSESLSWIVFSAIDLDALPADSSVVLIGDARAFYYQIPMSRLRYRTVFDVKSGAGDIVHAWLPADEPSHAVRLIDPKELKRFKASYTCLPPVPPEVQQRKAPYVQPYENKSSR